MFARLTSPFMRVACLSILPPMISNLVLYLGQTASKTILQPNEYQTNRQETTILQRWYTDSSKQRNLAWLHGCPEYPCRTGPERVGSCHWCRKVQRTFGIGEAYLRFWP